MWWNLGRLEGGSREAVVGRELDSAEEPVVVGLQKLELAPQGKSFMVELGGRRGDWGLVL